MSVGPSMKPNGWRYEKLPIEGDFLSSYTKVEVGYNTCIKYYPGNFLYRMLATVNYASSK
jgi:hypothetical protein